MYIVKNYDVPKKHGFAYVNLKMKDKTPNIKISIMRFKLIQGNITINNFFKNVEILG